LVGVAHPGGRTTDRRRAKEGVAGTRAARPRTGLGLVADTSRRTTGLARRPERAGRRAAGGAQAVRRAEVALLGAVDDPVAAIVVVEGQIDLAEVRGPG